MSASPTQQFDHVNYDVLDKAKAAFIEASKKTLNFAGSFGQVAQSSLGASANIFSLNLQPFINHGLTSMQIALVPEGLGTADDARPDDLTPSELEEFWYNIGIKSIAVMTNDAATAGVQTVLVGMYLPSAAPEVVFTEEFMKGFLAGYVQACKEVGCIYISGETPQLKNKLYPDKLDIAGALFGVVPAGKQPISPNNLEANDHIVLVESSGPHENGFTTLRGLAPKLSHGYRTKLPDGQEFWRAINKGSKLYTSLIQSVLNEGIFLSNAENITGHGWQKIMRSSKPFTYHIEEYPQILPIFEFVKDSTGMSYHDLLSVFNSGSGLALFVRNEQDAKKIVAIANKQKLNAVVAGKVELSKDNARRVIVPKLSVVLEGEGFTLSK